MKDNAFLEEFLKITDIRTIIFIFVLIGLFFVIRKMEKKKVKFSTRTIVATVIGLLLGIGIQLIAGMPEDPSSITWLNEIATWYDLIGSGFMSLLKMLVVPIVFVSIIRVILNMKDGDNLGKLTSRSILVLVITTATSALVGIIVGNVMKLGVGMETKGIATEMREIVPLVDTMKGLIPSNPIAAMAEANIVAVIIFAVFLGLATKRQSKKYYDIVKPFIDLIEALYKIILSIAMTVIKFMPYAVIAMFANTITARGISSIVAVIKFIIAVYICVLIMLIIHLIIIAVCGLNPIKYIKNATQMLILAFTSRSSLGTLPVTIETLKDKQGVEEGIASFTASLGSNMGMNGCAGIYPALMAVAVGNMAGINMDISFYVMLLVVITISSFGIAGLPGSATMAVSVVLSGVGLGPYFPLASGIVAIDPILDMGRTMLNVNGTSVTAVSVARSLNKLDKNIFNN